MGGPLCGGAWSRGVVRCEVINVAGFDSGGLDSAGQGGAPDGDRGGNDAEIAAGIARNSA